MVNGNIPHTTAGRQAENADQTAEFAINPYDALGIHHLASFFPERPSGSEMEWPPGFMGELSRYIYCNSTMPIPEFSIATAIAFSAGILGRGWGVGRTGLNHNLIIIGPSAIGKNVIHYGIANLTKQLPGAASFIHFSECASGPALHSFVSTNPCALQVIGEVGAFWAAYSGSNYGDHTYQLVRQMLHLWEASGPDGTNVGRNYADSSKNLRGGVVTSPSYSSIGETFANIFYEALKKDEIWSQGLPSRLWIIEYNGERPKLNEKPLLELPKPMLDRMASVIQEAGMRTIGPQQPIGFTPEADEWRQIFRAHCDDNVDAAGDNEMERQIWGRANEKALRLAGLCAVWDKPTNPVITLEQCVWVEKMFSLTVKNLEDRINDGSFSKDDDHKREAMVAKRIQRWITVPRTDKTEKELRHANIVSRRFLQQEVSGLAPFRDFQAGATKALDMTLQTMIKNGYLGPAPKDKVAKNYKYHGDCYFVLGLPPPYNVSDE